ncbi:MAG TPA: hypothetical protein VMR41_05935 [Patescibacteria group bacterium]|nr:hypothetical protein [Patescibacteria group bacterium]
MNKEVTPLEQAYNDVPKRWYELHPNTHKLITVASPLALYTVNLTTVHADSVPAHVTGTVVFLLSALADRYSSFKVLRAREQSTEDVVKPEEVNYVIGDNMTSETFLKSKKAAALDLWGTALSSIDPAVGVGFAVGKIQATINNLRIAKRQNKLNELSANVGPY